MKAQLFVGLTSEAGFSLCSPALSQQYIFTPTYYSTTQIMMGHRSPTSLRSRGSKQSQPVKINQVEYYLVSDIGDSAYT